MMKRLLPFVALCALAWGVYLGRPGSTHERAQAPKPSPDATPPADTPVDDAPQAANDGSTEARDGCVFEDDAQLAYTLSFRAEAEVVAQLLGQPGSEPIRTESTQRMQMALRVVEATDRTAPQPSAVLLAQFSKLSAQGTGRLPDTMPTPFLLRIDDRCELTGFARTRALPRADARIQQAFAYELNTRWTEGEQATRTFDNSTGRAHVDIAARIADGQRTVVQSVARYEQLWQGKNQVALDFDRAPVKSETRVTMGDGPWLQRLDKHERLAGAAGSSATFVDARRTEPGADAPDRAAYVPERFVWENLLPKHIPTPRSDEVSALDERARDAVRHYTPQQARDRFMQRFERGAGIQDVWPELTHYLEARPEETDTLVAMMKRDEISTDASPAFYIALGRARTAQAKAALLDIMRDGVAPPIERIRAMFGLIDRQDVGEPLAREFALMARSITRRGDSDASRVLGREALLALGAMAGVQDDPGITRVAVAAAGLTIAEGEDEVERRPGYGAIANVGDPAYMHYAEEGSRRDAREREAAAIVVRRMHPDDTSDFVADWLAREDDPFVKEAIYTTVDLQTVDYPGPVAPQLLDQALQDLAAEPRVITRKAILNIVGRSVERYPRARQALLKQIPYELQEDSGIYDVIVRYLDPDEVRAAIAHVGEGIERDR